MSIIYTMIGYTGKLTPIFENGHLVKYEVESGAKKKDMDILRVFELTGLAAVTLREYVEATGDVHGKNARLKNLYLASKCADRFEKEVINVYADCFFIEIDGQLWKENIAVRV